MFRPTTLLTLGIALVAPWAASAAEVESGDHIHGVRFDVHGVFGGYGSLGAGLRVDIPILPDGIIEEADDELALSPGADVFFTDFYPDYYDGGPYVIPSLVLQWNFFLGSRWSVFPEAGVALFVGDRHYLRRGVDGFYLSPDLGLGARYQFGARNALLARVSTPTGLQLGVTF